MMAFDRLRKENKKDSALRLARCLLQGTSISLGIGDIDWDIDTAIRQCGGEPSTGYRYCTKAWNVNEISVGGSIVRQLVHNNCYKRNKRKC